MIRDVTKGPYFAGRGGDDTDAIQAAIDAGGRNPIASPTGLVGNIVYLPGGDFDPRAPRGGATYRVYNVTRPLRVYGGVTIQGDDRMTCINGRAIPRGRGAFEFQHTQFAAGQAWWIAGNKFHNLRIESGGHAFRSVRSDRANPMNVFTLDNEWHSVEIVSKGSGLYFPWQYAQGNVVNGVQHRNPCYGGVVMWGNYNMIDRYRLVGGRGAWDGAAHTSPWLRDELGELIVDDPKAHAGGVNPARMGMIDVRGQGNTLRMNQVEFGPREPVVPYHFRAMGDTHEDVSLDANWSEIADAKMLVDGAAMRFDRVQPHGQWWASHVKYKYVDAGAVVLPTFDAGYTTASEFILADDRTFVDVGLYRSRWGAEFLPHMAVKRAFITGAYGGKMYDPNPAGPQLAYATSNGVEPGSAATFANPAPGHFVIDVTAAGAGAVKAWWQLTPTTAEGWALYSAEQSGSPNIQWWGNPTADWGVDELLRTTGGRRGAVPLKEWKPGAYLRLTANGVGRTEYRGVSVTRLSGAV